MRVKLKDVADRIKGNEDRLVTKLPYYLGGEHYESGSIAIYDKGLIHSDEGRKLGFKFHFPFQKGDTIFMARNPHLKKAGMVMYNGICSDASYILRTKDESVLLSRYLPLVMQDDRTWRFFEREKSGSTNFLMNWKELKEYEFELPDIETQRKIADLAWAMEETKQAYRRLMEKTDELVRSQFIARFVKDTSNGTLTTVENCCQRISSGGTPSMKHPEYYGGDIPFIKSGDVKTEQISDGALWLTRAALKETSAELLPKGTVIVVVRSAVLKREFHAGILQEPAVVNQDLKGFQPKDGILPEYLLWAIKSREDEILGRVQSMLTSHIEMKHLLSLKIRLASMEEQVAWKNFLHQAAASKSALQQSIDALQKTYRKLVSERLG